MPPGVQLTRGALSAYAGIRRAAGGCSRPGKGGQSWRGLGRAGGPWAKPCWGSGRRGWPRAAWWDPGSCERPSVFPDSTENSHRAEWPSAGICGTGCRVQARAAECGGRAGGQLGTASRETLGTQAVAAVCRTPRAKLAGPAEASRAVTGQALCTLCRLCARQLWGPIPGPGGPPSARPGLAPLVSG